MQRTTILLPTDLKRKAEREAAAAGISFSELIRQRLASSQGDEAAERAFWRREPWKGNVPSDLSENHDDYLYEE